MEKTNSDNKIHQLLSKAAESPKNAAKTLSKLVDELGDAMKGTVEFEVPKKYEKLISKFNSASDDISEDDVKNDLKGFDIKNVSKSFKDGDLVPVSLDLSKVKKIFKKCSKSVEDAKDAQMDESISLLNEGPDPFSVIAGVSAGLTVGYLIFVIAAVAYVLYVNYLIHRYEVTNIFTKPGEIPTASNSIASAAVRLLLPIIYFILIHIKINKMNKENPTNESAESDSVLDNLNYADSISALRDNESNRDSDLIEAYRKVVEDLTRRVPKETDPMK